MHGCAARPYWLLPVMLSWLLAGCGTAMTHRVDTDRFVTRAELEQIIRDAMDGGDELSAASLHDAIRRAEQSSGGTDDLIRRVHDALDTGKHHTSPSATRQLEATLRMIDRAIEVSITNLSNARTIGYQRRMVQVKDDGASFEVTLDREQGDPIRTDRDFDLMIRGEGYFVVNTTGGKQAYTRAGNFFLNQEGQFVLGNSDGLVVEPILHIPIEASDLAVSSDGVVSAHLPGDAHRVELGRIRLARFANADGLKADGALLRETPASGPPIMGDPGSDDLGTILQHTLENSNVDLSAELRQILMLRRWSRTVARALDHP